jgi:metal-responsive CopG/Arc/MetJ family transcriptional regulator
MIYIINMTTKKPQILLTLTDDDLIKGIDDYHFNNRIISRSEAIRQLIRAGIKSEKSKTKKK